MNVVKKDILFIKNGFHLKKIIEWLTLNKVLKCVKARDRTPGV